jgi:hypothetical protein
MAVGPRWTPTAVRGGTLVLAGILGFVAGCPFELQRGLSCGDGWWDPEYEECDPRDTEKPYLDNCRDQGFILRDATCDPQTCLIRASEEDCNACGDGIAAGSEQCDGEDLREQTCVGNLTCDANCQLDYSACEQVCGDGVVLGDEECEAGVESGFKNLACSNYESTAVGVADKPYASGTIGACNKDSCTFGRNDCSFCGDGVLDPLYTDIIAPQGTAEFPGELCDGDEVDPTLLDEHCEVCVEDAINGDVVLSCDFECAADCSGIAPINDIIPGPESLGCCIAKDSPCPLGQVGVPDLPCCSWLEKPEWAAIELCVWENTLPEMGKICP